MRKRLVLLVLVCLALPASLAQAAPLLGEPWEAGILEGVREQEQARERDPNAATQILRQAQLRAARRSDATTDVVRLYLLARAYGLAGDGGSAVATYREVLQKAPRCYFAYHDLGMLSLQRTPPDVQAAERFLRQSISANPSYVVGYKKLSRILLEAGRTAEAVTFLRRVVDLEPGEADARTFLAGTLLELDQLDEAEREIAVLYRKDRTNTTVRNLMGALYVKRGRLADAKRVYRALASDHPTWGAPLQGYLRCLQTEREQGTMDHEEWLWAFEALYRLERDPERRAALRQEIENFRRGDGAAPQGVDETPEGPPSDAQMVDILERVPEEIRADLLRYVYARPEPPAKELLGAVIRRLDPEVEPAARVRQWALRVLSRFGGFGMTGLVRHSLGDPDPIVRPVAVDALVALSLTDSAAAGAAILILGLQTDASDAVLSGAARAAVLDLVRGQLPSDVANNDAARRAAFRAWWASNVAVQARVTALEGFETIADLFPEQILLPYLIDADPYVAEAAWKQLTLARRRLVATGTMAPQRARWYQGLPTYVKGALTGSDGVARRRQLAAWAARKPGA